MKAMSKAGQRGNNGERLRFDFPDGLIACAVEISDADELPSAIVTLGLQPPRPTMVLVGGAGGLDESDVERLRPTFVAGIVPMLERFGAVAVDGGTHSGVMRILGEARSALGATFPLVGVVAAGTVRIPGRPDPPNADAMLEPHHTHFLIVPGEQWGAESPWIADTATVLGGTAPSVTVLINGGQIAYLDVEHSVQATRRVIVIAGSGRTADALASALAGIQDDERAQALVASGLVSSVPMDEAASFAHVLAATLSEQPPTASSTPPP
jgi:SLOG in TRPM, prokaryote